MTDPLLAKPGEFSFLQAVWLLHRTRTPQQVAVGGKGPPKNEAVRFSGRPSFAFRTSELEALSRAPNGGPPTLFTSVLPLYGLGGSLPDYFTDLLLEEKERKPEPGSDPKTPLRDFLDLFHHRLLSVYYRAWVETTVIPQYEDFAGGGTTDYAARDPLTRYLLDETIVASAVRAGVRVDALVRWFGLVSLPSRPRWVAERVLSDYFDLPVVIRQWTGTWTEVAAAAGSNEVVRVHDPAGRLRLRIGPICGWRRYAAFTPNGNAVRPLAWWVRTLVGPELEFETELEYTPDDPTEVVGCRLDDEVWAQLDLTTWLVDDVIPLAPGWAGRGYMVARTWAGVEANAFQPDQSRE